MKNTEDMTRSEKEVHIESIKREIKTLKAQINGDTLDVIEHNFGFHIKPFYGKIHAEVFEKVNGCEELLISRKFGRWYSNQPNHFDYIDAREWCEMHIDCLVTYNKEYEG